MLEKPKIFWVSILLNIILGLILFMINFQEFGINDFIFPYDHEYNYSSDFPIDFDNATSIFNTVQGALKQKDLNLHPVGVS